ncbi:MAG: hypothetical protein WA738_04720 [Candidatus Angelobacter sp.]
MFAQGTPPSDPDQTALLMVPVSGTPPAASVPRMQQMKNLIKARVRRAIDGNPYPSLQDWIPLTAREKFDVFLHSTYSPRTFLNAGIDVVANHIKRRDRNVEYETGFRGWGQHYGTELGTSESDIFFQKFLLPAILKQDPRYYRNPDLPFVKRALYSMSRVLITRTDSGGQAFNSSKILGAMASRALSDLYVPGQRQGLHPLTGCVSFNLLRDAGMNMVHEFWPDFRHKFLHR